MWSWNSRMTSASVEPSTLWTSTSISSSPISVSQTLRNTLTCCPSRTASSEAPSSATCSCQQMRWTHSCCRTRPGRRPFSRNSDGASSLPSFPLVTHSVMSS